MQRRETPKLAVLSGMLVLRNLDVRHSEIEIRNLPPIKDEAATIVKGAPSPKINRANMKASTVPQYALVPSFSQYIKVHTLICRCLQQSAENNQDASE